MKGVPYRCEKCVEEASYNGMLLFPSMPEPPTCRHHKYPMVPVPQPKKVKPWAWEPEAENE